MDDKQLRLECLQMAVKYGSMENIKDPVALAEIYLKWVENKSLDKVRKSPQSDNSSKS
tara:strand:+ start:1558 stop:1731 length:174 start_codon:yes stop_codon:yes gene_type:complete